MSINSGAVIISEALEKAGNPSLSTRAQTWLAAGLDSLYAAWSWPFLQQSYQFTLAQGASTLLVATTQPNLRVYNCLRAQLAKNGAYVCDPDLYSPEEVPGPMDPTLNTLPTGRPQCFVVDPASVDGMTFKPFPKPDQSYTLQLTLQAVAKADVTPASIGTPKYPSDETLIQLVVCEAFWHMDDERFTAAEGKFQQLVAKDRAKYGRTANRGRWMLARRTFGDSTRAAYRSRYAWMGT